MVCATARCAAKPARSLIFAFFGPNASAWPVCGRYTSRAFLFAPHGSLMQNDAPARAPEHAPINWVTSIVMTATPLAAITVVPWYGFTHGFSLTAWLIALACLWAGGISITAGYHRLWAHRAYSAHWSVRFFFMLFGAMSLQNSILTWASQHRTHHRFVDDWDQDPYSAKRGFWFSHMGWILRNYPSGRDDFTNAKDLERDPLVMF